MSGPETTVELAGALAGLMREHGELVSLASSLARIGDQLAEGKGRVSPALRDQLQLVLTELRLWAIDGEARGRQRRADEVLARYIQQVRALP
jgi:hypothetical protein